MISLRGSWTWPRSGSDSAVYNTFSNYFADRIFAIIAITMLSDMIVTVVTTTFFSSLKSLKIPVPRCIQKT